MAKKVPSKNEEGEGEGSSNLDTAVGAPSSSGGKSAREEATPLPPTPVASPPPIEESCVDPICVEQGRHRANCDCKGSARGPIGA